MPETWRDWREALEGRLKRLKAQRKAPEEGDDLPAIDAMIAETEAQIDALGTEEIISTFVEAEVDLALNSREEY